MEITEEPFPFDSEYKQALQAAFEAPIDLQVIRKKLPELHLTAPFPSPSELYDLAVKLTVVPAGVEVHPRLKKNLDDRLKELQDKQLQASIDWGFAETLAFGSLLMQKVPIRFAGQDSRRGTFSQRHAVWVDQKDGREYLPLSSCGKFEIYDSPLSEYAALGFEYGYSLGNPAALDLWEAQFGDFANGAQVIMDQYIAAGESKWGVTTNLTLLLPHGYEGQGPEHSSGRMERFLQLAAEDNCIVANPTTPAQYFHLLRRQATKRKPLIVFTPKGLLRHPECKSTLQELSQGTFKEIINDAKREQDVERMIFCQGRVFYDVQPVMNEKSAVIRMEQLYPFDTAQVKALIDKYQRARKWYWVQEEPKNAGAWNFIKEKIEQLLPSGGTLRYVGREEAASPAVASHEVHVKQLHKILEQLR